MSILVGSIGGLMQKKPKVPKFTPVDIGQEQAKAIRANTTNFAGISDVAGQVNQFNQDQLLKALRAAIPGYDTIMSKGSENVTAMLSGELPADVSAAVARASAARGVSGGFAGSDAFRKLQARDLGLTSLDLTQRGLDAASRWLANAAVAPQMDVTSMFVSPEQAISVAMANTQGQFQRDWMKRQIDAAYDPMTIIGKQIQQTDAQITEAALGAAGSFLGGVM